MTHFFELADVLLNLEEQLLFNYCYYPEEGKISLACEWPETKPDVDRAFIQLIFNGVENFEREHGIQLILQGYVGEYFDKSAPCPTVIEDVATKTRKDGSKEIAFWFGGSFGGISFSCFEILGRTRYSYVKKRNNSRDYFDCDTGEKFDFSDPFAGLDTQTQEFTALFAHTKTSVKGGGRR